MELLFLGAGAAFTMEQYQTNMVAHLSSGETRYNLLIDCGSDIRFSLKNQNMSHLDIHGVYISHLHADHIGGLEYLGFMTYFDPNYKGKPQLFINEALVDDLWSRSLSGGMSSLQGQINTLSTFFDVQVVKKNETFEILDDVFQPVQTIHIMNGFGMEPSFGLMINDELFITTDTPYAPAQIETFYQKAKVIVHDCETGYASGVHAHIDDLRNLPEDVRAKMILCHYQDDFIGNDALVEELGFHSLAFKGTELKI